MSKLLSSIIAFFLISSTAQAIEFSTKTTARIDRQNRSVIFLHLEFANVTAAEIASLGITNISDTTNVVQGFANNLNICVGDAPPACADTAVNPFPVRWNPARTSQPLQVDGLVSTNELMRNAKASINEPAATSTVPGLKDIVVDIEILNNSAAFTSGTTKVAMRLFPNASSGGGSQKDFTATSALGSGVSVLPEVTAVRPSKKSINVEFVKATSVTFEDTTTGAPSGIQGFLIHNITTEPIAIPAYVYEDNPTGAPADAACTVAASADGTSCAVTCVPDGGRQTLNMTGALPGNSSTFEITNYPASNIASFNNLTLGQQYAVVYSFKPDGTKIGCAIGEPSDAATLLQIATGKEPKPGDPTCFIATAAYGSPIERHVRVLRWFRDQYLIPHDLGRSLVKLYYRYSPPAAQWIAERPLMRSITRGVLWLPVMSIELWRDQPYLLLLALLLPGFFLFTRRKIA